MDRASLQHETITDRDANLSRDFLNSMTLEALMLSAIELKLQFGSARNLSTRIRPWDWSNRLHSCNLRNLQNCTQVKADGVERLHEVFANITDLEALLPIRIDRECLDLLVESLLDWHASPEPMRAGCAAVGRRSLCSTGPCTAGDEIYHNCSRM
ncbi:hypothetical protein FIE12Z_12658, partial [Fusarium flagelliforme]